jgi:hypothetical protein
VTANRVGELTIGGCVPLALAAKAQLDLALGVELPSLQARLAGLLALQARLSLTPPSLAASLDLALKLVAALQASIALGLPGISFQLQAAAALIAQIELDLGKLQGSAAFAASLGLLLGAPGVFAYVYHGQVGHVGSELQTEINAAPPGGSPIAQADALLLLTAMPATWTSMEAVFKTAP